LGWWVGWVKGTYHVLDGGPTPHCKGQNFCREMGRRNVTYMGRTWHRGRPKKIFRPRGLFSNYCGISCFTRHRSAHRKADLWRMESAVWRRIKKQLVCQPTVFLSSAILRIPYATDRLGDAWNVRLFENGHDRSFQQLLMSSCPVNGHTQTEILSSDLDDYLSCCVKPKFHDSSFLVASL